MMKKKVAPGKFVNVNGHDMHVFSQGVGNVTFVFMSGFGTRFPTLDFEPLWSLLSTNNQIAVVDKAGYGWSKSTGSSRDIDTMLNETRTALQLAGITAPYVLVPHSASGLEALYWAQMYPNEVKAIIGLDPRVPTFEKLPPKFIGKLLKFLGAFTPDTLNEIEHLVDNTEKVKNLPLPTATPIYFFISGKNGIKDWEDILISYLSDFEISKHLTLNCGHYVHKYEAEKIAEEINKFIKSIG